MATWHNDLPDPSRSISVTAGSNLSKKKWQSGRTENRRFGAGAPDRVKMQIRLKTEQVRTFESWYNRDLNLGINWFTADWLAGLGYTTHSARIVEYPKLKGQSPLHADYILSLAVQETAYVPADTAWLTGRTGVPPAPGYIEASGGTITELYGYRIHTFTEGGTFLVNSMPENAEIDVCLVAGGGTGGAGSLSGGGGAGGMLQFGFTPEVGAYPIVIGAGATGDYSLNGDDSTAFGQIAFGGGGGGARFVRGFAGGSGGGNGRGRVGGNPGVVGQGNAGGGEQWSAGGGGGAGRRGGSGGGHGQRTIFDCIGTFLAGGGTGDKAIPIFGGYGGGGNKGQPGTPNTGGGAGCNNTQGGSGICIIRYPISEEHEGLEWQLRTSVYTEKSRDFSTALTGNYRPSIRISADGTRLISHNSGPSIYQFTLSTPWDITIATLDYTLDVSAHVNSIGSIELSPDGTQLYFAKTNTFFQFTLSTAWALSTASFTGSYNPGYSASVLEMRLSPDGSKIYLSRSNNITQHTLSTPWDITTMSSGYYQFNMNWAAVGGFNSDGTVAYIHTQESTGDIREYNLSTPYNLSTATATTGEEFVAHDVYPLYAAYPVNRDIYSIEISKDGKHLYIYCEDQTIYQFSIGVS